MAAKDLPVVPSAKGGSMAAAPSGITWREQYPILSEKCDACLECTLLCPEGALAEEQGKMQVNLRLCKGCGICAVECKQKCITMTPEFTGVPGVFPVKEGK